MEDTRRYLLVLLLLNVFLVCTESQAISNADSLPSLVLEDGSSEEPKGANSRASESLDQFVKPLKDITSQLDGVLAATESLAKETIPASGPTSAVPVESNEKNKDINQLLANKNDAENDLAASPVAPSSPAIVEDKKPVELDSPVDVKSTANDDRFHYNMASSDKASSDDIKPEQDPAPVDSPMEPKKELPVVEKQAADIKPAVTTVFNVDQLEAKKIEVSKPEPVASKPAVEEISSEIPVKKVVTLPEEPAKAEPMPLSETASTTQAPSSTTEAPNSTTSIVIIQSPKIEVPRIETPKVEAPKAEIPKVEVTNTSVGSLEESKQIPMSGSDNSTKNTSEVPTKAEKSPIVPSVLATALGSALGGAVIPSINKEKSTPTITSKPPVSSTTSRSTIRKSSTDRWDRWTPPTSTSSPRRRPILPSIRRRFRPYNRFSPFPWVGPEPYSPLGSDPDYLPQDPDFHFYRPSAPSGTTNKPRRRVSIGTEWPKTSSSSSPSSPPSGSNENDDEVPASSSRRRANNSGKRRHQHSERRRHQSGHRYDDSDSSYESPYGEAPMIPSPGFSLFNVGPAGSGFDLLNPFSGWLDSIDKSKPPVRPVVGRPEIDESGSHRSPGIVDTILGTNSRPHVGRDEYLDHHHHRHDCRDDYDYDRRPLRPSRDPYRPGGEREPYRPVGERDPYRPVGDRDPYRPGNGDYETYGERPHRPYSSTRREQNESSGTTVIKDKERESSEASPSLYGSRGERLGSVARTSLFSPFESLFGHLDDDLFGLRSSFQPLKMTADFPQMFKPKSAPTEGGEASDKREATISKLEDKVKPSESKPVADSIVAKRD